jgi:hypothetical protein
MEIRGPVKVVPDIKVPNRGKDNACRFGVGELLYICFSSSLPADQQRGQWQIVSGGGTLNNLNVPGLAEYFCPGLPAQVTLRFVVPQAPIVAAPAAVLRAGPVPAAAPPAGQPAAAPPAGPVVVPEIKFSVVGPELKYIRYYRFHWSSDDPNAGFWAAWVLKPDDVSFARVALREVGGDNKWTATRGDGGTIAAAVNLIGRRHDEDHLRDARVATMEPWFSTGFNRHARVNITAANLPTLLSLSYIDGGRDVIREVKDVRKSGQVMRTEKGTVLGIDRVYSPIIVNNPKPWVAKGDRVGNNIAFAASLTIAVHYKVVTDQGALPAGGTTGTLLGENVHAIEVRNDGTCTVSKGGSSATFHRRDATVVDKPGGNTPTP